MTDREDTSYRKRARAGASSLLAISLLVLASGCLCAVAVPIGKRALQNHRARLVASDLRTFSAAFQRYAKEHGDWPTGGRPAGKIPNGMGLYLLGTHWADVTPIGGHYQWCRNSPQSGGRYTAVIVIASSEGTAPSNRSDQLRMLEEAVDRDTASAGNLFLGYRNFPVYVLEH